MKILQEEKIHQTVIRKISGSSGFEGMKKMKGDINDGKLRKMISEIMPEDLGNINERISKF